MTLALTAAGRTRWKKAMSLIDQRNQDIFGCLAAAEQRQLGDMFDRLIAHAKAQGAAKG